MNKEQKLEDCVLGTLSFFDPLTLSQLLVQMDPLVVETAQWTIDDLRLCIGNLKRQGLVKTIQKDGENSWVRVYKRPGLFKRLSLRWKKLRA